MRPRYHFPQSVLDWFEEGDTLESRPDLAPYEPFKAIPWRSKVATLAASVIALLGTVWLLS